MRPDRAPYVGIGCCDRAHFEELVEPRADRQHRADPGASGPCDDRVALGREVREIEMAVAVDQHLRGPQPSAAASVSTKRGKIPCGAGNGRPGGSGVAKSAKR